MVGVSDDVNEYAMALRDTEDKLRRCPKRVSWAAGGSLRGWSVEEGNLVTWVPQGALEGNLLSCPCLWGLPSSSPCPHPCPGQTTLDQGQARPEPRQPAVVCAKVPHVPPTPHPRVPTTKC